jgi:hypothetical protein
MRIETSINLIPDQPSEAAWAALRNLAAEWNRSHLHGLTEISGITLQLRIPDSTLADQDEIRALVDKMRSEAGVRVYPASRRIYNEQDYREAAFVEIVGVTLDRPGRPFVVNSEKALGPPVPCPNCGWQDIFNVPQRAPFTIDESLLDDPLLGGETPHGGWDFVALPAGRQLLSERLLVTLRQADLRGLEVQPVLAADTGRVSGRAFQISAGTAVLVPCSQHESGVSYCTACGAVLDSQEPEHGDDCLFTPQAEFRVNRAQLAGDEVLSRHPACAAMLYFAQRAYRMLSEARFNGVRASGLIQLCEHNCAGQ